MRRHHARFSVLFPMIAGLVACGGSVTGVEGASSSGGSSSSSGGGSSSSSGGTVSSGSSGSSGTSGASGSSGSSGSTTSSGGAGSFDIDLCNGAQVYDALSGVTPATKVDYMELRDEYQTYGGSPVAPHVVSKSGTPCASASDKPACQSALTNARSNGWPVTSVGMEQPRERYLVATLADNLQFATSEPDLLSFIAPIDNAHDAALIVTANAKYRIECGKPNARKSATGYDVRVLSGHTCGQGSKIEEHVIAVTTSGQTYTQSTTLIEEGDPGCVFGRKPAGLCARSQGSAHDALGEFFARAAYLEAASVFAFERLEEELRALDAPRDLIDAARSSRGDEIRHARMTKKLATRFGATVAEPDVDPNVANEARSAYEIALENAVEGCVRETYAAVVAHWQAQACSDRQIARVMKAIAEDETKHAALAWDVAAWLEPKLTADERARIDAAREAARAELRASLARELDENVIAITGMPRTADALALFEAVSAAA